MGLLDRFKRRAVVQTDDIWPFLKIPSRAKRIDGPELTKLIHMAAVSYGQTNNDSMVGGLKELYEIFIGRVAPDGRADLCSDLHEEVISGATSATALLPFLDMDPDPTVTSTAAFGFSVLYPPQKEDPMTGPRVVLAGMMGGSARCPGGLLGGLLLLADERVNTLVWDRKEEFSDDVVAVAMECQRGFLSYPLVDFLLSWLEERPGGEGDSLFGILATGLAQCREGPPPMLVIDAERIFPAPKNSDDPQRVKRSWPMDEFTAIIAPSLTAMEEKEGKSDVMTRVLRAWQVGTEFEEQKRAEAAAEAAASAAADQAATPYVAPFVEPEPLPVVEATPASEVLLEPKPEPVIAREPAPEPEPVVAHEPEPEPVVAYEPEPDPVAAEPEPEAEPVAAHQPDPEVPPEPVVAPEPQLVVVPSLEPQTAWEEVSAHYPQSRGIFPEPFSSDLTFAELFEAKLVPIIQWGTFDPFGPTLCILGLSHIDGQDTSLVVLRTNHPHSPSVEVVGITCRETEILPAKQVRLANELCARRIERGGRLIDSIPTHVVVEGGLPLAQARTLFLNWLRQCAPPGLAEANELHERNWLKPWDRARDALAARVETIKSGVSPLGGHIDEGDLARWWSLATDPHHLAAEFEAIPIAWASAMHAPPRR